ncbi:glycosyltransferase family 4 protein [Phascolarctobacterium succinatutens]|uniref:glycosyltransferase family 4 protein n=1 Tax=Phascolarctobacterium succinatutens TaxID=626940 RepID=UPI0026EEBCCF|nr:glycosyltransferase family 4 protein [Phascolarctobacterium succinatutens]
MKKHILVVSQYFYPEQFRINDICQEWVKRGFKVTVITGIPNYPEGKYYEGYGILKKRKETWNGIDIIRIPLIPRGKSKIGLVCNYLSFPVSGFIWNLLSNIKADYVFNFETSPMTQTLIAVWYAQKHKVPCYLYVQDLWPEAVETVTGIHNPFIIKPLDTMVRYIYKHCDKIFCTSPSFVRDICKRGVDKKKVYYWPQYAEELYRPAEKHSVPEIEDDDSFKIIFTGNIGYAQGLDTIPKAAKILKSKGANVKFYIVGDGRYKQELIKEISYAGVEDMVLLIGRHPAKRIPEFLACCDVAYVSFMNDSLFSKTIPAKVQSYMACGMPVLAASEGETNRIVQKADCGLCSRIGDEVSLAENVEKMMSMEIAELERMGKNAREFCNRYFSKKVLMDQMDEWFK